MLFSVPKKHQGWLRSRGGLGLALIFWRKFYRRKIRPETVVSAGRKSKARKVGLGVASLKNFNGL